MIATVTLTTIATLMTPTVAQSGWLSVWPSLSRKIVKWRNFPTLREIMGHAAYTHRRRLLVPDSQPTSQHTGMPAGHGAIVLLSRKQPGTTAIATAITRSVPEWKLWILSAPTCQFPHLHHSQCQRLASGRKCLPAAVSLPPWLTTTNGYSTL